MSVRVMTQVWETPMPAKDKLVLLALADCANDEGLAWPSITTLARKCGCDERTVQRNLRELEKACAVKREEVIGKGCRYIVTPRQYVTPGKKSPVTKTTKTPGKLPPKPSRTVNEGLADAKPMRAKGWPEIPDWIPAVPWNAYHKMRGNKRAKATPRAVELLLKDLTRWRAKGHDPGVILDASTVNNWTGLFEPKEVTNGKEFRGSGSNGPDKRSGLARAIDGELSALSAFP